MNPNFHQLMRDATDMTRSGNLQAATQTIQRALAGATATAPTPQSTPAPAPAGIVLDGLTRIVPDDEVRTPLPSAAGSGQRAAPAQARSPSPASTPAPASTGASTTAPAQGQWKDGSFARQGRTVAYKLYVPGDQPRARPADGRPLIVMLHGCTQSAADFAAGTQMHALAEAQGALVLYPEQNQQYNPQRCWNWFKPQHQQQGRGEPALLAALTQSIAAQYGADATRVYVAGLSAGGAMADILGHRYPDVFAAAGVHSGLSAGDANDMLSALAVMRSGPAKQRKMGDSAGTALPTIVFHGDADATVNVRNGTAIVEAVRFAADAPETTATTAPVGLNATRTMYTTRDGVDRVEYWQLHGVGHAWSGGSPQGSFTHPGGVDASAEMLRFFMQHRHP